MKIIACILVALALVTLGYSAGSLNRHVIVNTTDQVTSFNDGFADGQRDCPSSPAH